jgi:hypothetical protein
LEGQTDGRGQVALAQASQHSQFTQLLTDKSINLVRALALSPRSPLHGTLPSFGLAIFVNGFYFVPCWSPLSTAE